MKKMTGLKFVTLFVLIIVLGIDLFFLVVGGPSLSEVGAVILIVFLIVYIYKDSEPTASDKEPEELEEPDDEDLDEDDDEEDTGEEDEAEDADDEEDIDEEEATEEV